MIILQIVKNLTIICFLTKKFRDELLQKADDRQILDNLKNYHMETFSMHREEE